MFANVDNIHSSGRGAAPCRWALPDQRLGFKKNRRNN